MKHIGKIEARLELALFLSKALREKQIVREESFIKEKNLWEFIVKYHGNLEAQKENVPFSIEFLSGGYAIVLLEERNIQEFVSLPEVDYVEAPSRLWYALEDSRSQVCLRLLQQNASFPLLRTLPEEYKENEASTDLYGAGVLISIIDSSVDYAHPDFRNEDGTTRILALWDQTIDSNTLNEQSSFFQYGPPNGYLLGTLFTEEMINAALSQNNIESRRKIVPSVDLSGHGTHVAGIACGNGSVSGGTLRGVAPLASMLVVKLGDLEGVTFPRTTRLMEAVDFSIQFAQERQMPVVVNLSFGNSSGSHTGEDLVSQYLNQVATNWKTVICAGTGNEGNTGRHRAGNLSNHSVEQIEMAVAGEQSGFYVQLWKQYEDDFSIEIRSPKGQSFVLENNQIDIYLQEYEDCFLAINYGEPTPFQVLQEVYVEWLPKEERLAPGIWNINLFPKKIVYGRYDIWMPAGNFIQNETRFLQPTIDTTLTMPSGTNRLISVGAYDGRREQIAGFSGRGYTRNEQIKPDLVAPGVDILSAAPNNSYAVRSGTSMATPFVSGGAAILMEWGIMREQDPYLYGQKMKAFLRKGAGAIPNGNVPNPSWGWGTLCVQDSIPR